MQLLHKKSLICTKTLGSIGAMTSASQRSGLEFRFERGVSLGLKSFIARLDEFRTGVRFRDSSWASISAVDFLCVTAGSRGMRPGSRLRPLWLILSLDDPMNYSGGLVCKPCFGEAA